MAGFALNLDLSLYFEDLRKYSRVFVDLAKCTEVGDVEKHIKSVFKLEDNICLTNEKFLIPSCENIQILQQCETHKVQKRDFVDQQTSQTKPTNTICDQIALNLIQSDRSIDLSCRPKQRLKINICQNNCMTGAPLPHFVESGRFVNVPRLISASPTDSSQHQPKEKQKNKKRKHNIDKDVCQVDDNILDMSVQSEGKIHVNTDEEYEPSINCIDKLAETSINKTLKRKCCGNLVGYLGNSILDDVFTTSDSPANNIKKQKSRSLRVVDDNLNTVTNLSHSKEEELYNDSGKSKHKKSRKSAELIEHIDQNDEYYHCSPKVDISRTEENRRDNVSKGEIKVSKIVADLRSIKCSDKSKRVDTKTLSSSSSQEVESLNVSQRLRTNECELEECSENREEHNCIEQDVKPQSEHLEPKLKRKRVRKHNKKKKHDKLAYMSAVGPILSSLTEEISSYKPPVTTSAKHVFFTDDCDSLEITQPVKMNTSTEDKVEGDEETCSTDSSRRDLLEKPTWQDELRKLATSSSKPVIFSRNSLSISDKIETPQVNDSCETLLQIPQANSTPILKKDVITNDLNTNLDLKSDKLVEKMEENTNLDLKSDKLVEKMEENTNLVLKSDQLMEKMEETVDAESKHCNGKVNGTETNVCPTRVSQSKKSSGPITFDIQNVILHNYPVIDKILVGDLILFKMLKLNENKQPGISKTILGKVSNCSHFPQTISLEILDGSSECSDIFVEGDKNFVELRWAELIEPRLFYP